MPLLDCGLRKLPNNGRNSDSKQKLCQRMFKKTPRLCNYIFCINKLLCLKGISLFIAVRKMVLEANPFEILLFLACTLQKLRTIYEEYINNKLSNK